MDHCILYRSTSGAVQSVLDNNGDIMTWPDADLAITFHDTLPRHMVDLPWQLVELDEL